MKHSKYVFGVYCIDLWLDLWKSHGTHLKAFNILFCSKLPHLQFDRKHLDLLSIPQHTVPVPLQQTPQGLYLGRKKKTAWPGHHSTFPSCCIITSSPLGDHSEGQAKEDLHISSLQAACSLRSGSRFSTDKQTPASAASPVLLFLPRSSFPFLAPLLFSSPRFPS